MKLGIVGGTFNPIHFGHLRAAEEIREELRLDEVLFIPSNIPPHRPLESLVPFFHRYQMVKMATVDNPYFAVSGIEGKRPGKSYTIDTLKALYPEYPNAVFYFIIGLDAFLEINTWKKPQELFKLTHFVVIPRKGFGKKQILHAVKTVYPHLNVKMQQDIIQMPHGKNIHFCPISSLDISATQIRNLVKANKSIRYLVPRAVEEYIYQNGFYRGDDETKD
ncbi:MAG: nicotinate-nucleotide adenylyltransferase [Candidatus Desulfofervidaceae bacterium]|nr:nicotinate-nucleotide adenylyltransferase [Candidatus Desulfofervidaceae bacterium]